MKANLNQATLIASELNERGVSLRKAMKIGLDLSEKYLLVTKPRRSDESAFIELVDKALSDGVLKLNQSYTASDMLELMGIEPSRSKATKLSCSLVKAFVIERSRGNVGQRLIKIVSRQ